MSKSTKSNKTAEALTPSALNKIGLKDLISMAEALGYKYDFQKKPAIVEFILDNQDKEVLAPKAKSAKKVSKPEVEDIVPEIAAKAEEAASDEAPEEVAQEEVAAKETPKAKKPKAEKADKKPSSTDADLEKLREIKAIKDILELKDKDGNDHTKSEKIRRLYFRAGVTIGQAAKLMGIHYSFAFCVIDAFRKNHPSDEKKK